MLLKGAAWIWSRGWENPWSGYYQPKWQIHLGKKKEESIALLAWGCNPTRGKYRPDGKPDI